MSPTPDQPPKPGDQTPADEHASTRGRPQTPASSPSDDVATEEAADGLATTTAPAMVSAESIDELSTLLNEGDEEAIARFVRLLDLEEARYLLHQLEDAHKNDVFEHLPEDIQLQLLTELIDAGQAEQTRAFVQLLPPVNVAYLISQLDDDERRSLFEQLPPGQSANLLEHFIDEQAADFLETLSAETAASIIDELDSDDQTDVIQELDRIDAMAIIEQMAPEEAEDVRRLLEYGQDVAGGLMITEYLVFRDHQTVGDVRDEMRANADRYHEFDVQTVHVVDGDNHLQGVVRFRDVLLAPAARPLVTVMKPAPASVEVHEHLDELVAFFDHHPVDAAPVLDDDDRLVGVLRRAAVQEELGERADRALLRFGGIIAGEELRTMPLASRALRRMAYLAPNTVLFLLSISIIAMFEWIIADVPAVAVFLPLVAGMSGATGNQAVAVSMRELALDLVRPRDAWKVLRKEAAVGVVNGLAIGLAVGLIALAMRGDPIMGAIVGVAFAFNSVFAVVLGGVTPLALKGVGVDPAMAAGPLVTTTVDMLGFLLLLCMTWMMQSQLTLA